MTESSKNLYREFLEEEKLSGRRPGGLIILRQKVRNLIEYLEENQLSLSLLTVREAQEYQGFLLKRGRLDGKKYVNSSIKPHITAAIAFYNFLKRKGMALKNPFKDIRRVRTAKVLPKNLLKEKEMDRFLKEIKNYRLKGNLKERITRYRYHVIAELMYSTGLRISETANLKAEDIDFERGLVQVIEGKQGISRIAFLNEYAKELLRIYVNRMREAVFNEWNRRNGTLFGVKTGNLEKEFNKFLKEVSEKCGFPKITSHHFRHCLGYHLLRAGCDIRFIQEILGHKCLRNTEIYTKVDKKDLKKVLDRFHPRTFDRQKREAENE